jgi:predicted CopG family antitoxin
VHDKCMAVKTITIDMEAYDTLSRRKAAGQSFSDVIKAHFGPQPTAGRFRDLVRTVRVGSDATDAMERQVRARSRHPARTVTL